METDIEFDCDYFSSPVKLLKSYEEGTAYDLLFLDVEMEPLNGISVAKKIRSIPDKDVRIVFVTDHEEQMRYGFDVQATYYLLKSSLKSEFKKVMNLVISTLNNDQSLLTLRTDRYTSVLVKIKDIIFIESIPHKRDVVIYHTSKGQSIEEKSSILSVGNILRSKGFVFVNKHSVINTQYISEFTNDNVILTNNISFPISRSYKKTFNDVFAKKLVIEDSFI